MKLPTKAVIAAAGLGTRFLPQTKAMPKEMLPIIDKPVIQLVIEEVVAAGVSDIIIVTGSTKRAIEDHFDRSDTLESELIEKGKTEKAEQIKKIANMANFIYVRQKGSPKGNARPVLTAQHLIAEDEPFFVFSADDFFSGKVPRAVQMKEAFIRNGGKSVISLTKISPDDSDKYGVVSIKDDIGGGTFKLGGVIEKPGKENMPSQYASLMGYLLTPDILPIIAKEKVDKSGEIVLVDSINEFAQDNDVYGQVIEGTYHDTGDPLKYIQTLVDMALKHPEHGTEFQKYIKYKTTSN